MQVYIKSSKNIHLQRSEISSMLKAGMFPASLLQLQCSGPFPQYSIPKFGAGHDGLAAETEQPMDGYPSVSSRSSWGWLRDGQHSEMMGFVYTWEKNLPLSR